MASGITIPTIDLIIYILTQKQYSITMKDKYKFLFFFIFIGFFYFQSSAFECCCSVRRNECGLLNMEFFELLGIESR